LSRGFLRQRTARPRAGIPLHGRAEVAVAGLHRRGVELLLRGERALAGESRRPRAVREVQVAPVQLAQLGGAEARSSQRVHDRVVLETAGAAVLTEPGKERAELGYGERLLRAVALLRAVELLV